MRILSYENEVHSEVISVHFHINGCAPGLKAYGNSEIGYCEAVMGFGLTPNICPQLIFTLFAAVYNIKQSQKVRANCRPVQGFLLTLKSSKIT